MGRHPNAQVHATSWVDDMRLHTLYRMSEGSAAAVSGDDRSSEEGYVRGGVMESSPILYEEVWIML